MFVLTKRGLQHLAAPYMTADTAMAYGKWQSFNAPSSRCLLLLDDQCLQILSLNLFCTKVLYAQSIQLTALEEVRFKRHLSVATLHFTHGNQGYRFQLPLTILTLGNWQSVFFSRCDGLLG